MMTPSGVAASSGVYWGQLWKSFTKFSTFYSIAVLAVARVSPLPRKSKYWLSNWSSVGRWREREREREGRRESFVCCCCCYSESSSSCCAAAAASVQKQNLSVRSRIDSEENHTKAFVNVNVNYAVWIGELEKCSHHSNDDELNRGTRNDLSRDPPRVARVGRDCRRGGPGRKFNRLKKWSQKCP